MSLRRRWAGFGHIERLTREQKHILALRHSDPNYDPRDPARQNDGVAASGSFAYSLKAGVADDPSLADQLRRAVTRLEAIRDKPGVGFVEKARLNGKIEGVKLAASYLEDGQRIFPEVGR